MRKSTDGPCPRRPSACARKHGRTMSGNIAAMNA
jgi:hypothetical protein